MNSPLHVPSGETEDIDQAQFYTGIEKLVQHRDEIRELRLRNLELSVALEISRRKNALFEEYEADIKESLGGLVQSIVDSVEKGLETSGGVRGIGKVAEPGEADAFEAVLAKERNRIAQDIHDGLAQQLTGIVLELEACHRAMSTDLPHSEAQLLKAIKTTRSCLVDVRRFMYSLRNPSANGGGLIPSLERMVNEFEQRNSVPARLKILGTVTQVTSDIVESLLRIAQEALTNVGKHAQAKQVEVQLRFGPTSVEISIADDGVGFDTETVLVGASDEAKLGILGMQERAQAHGGSLRIESVPHLGTRVTALLPVGNEIELGSH